MRSSSEQDARKPKAGTKRVQDHAGELKYYLTILDSHGLITQVPLVDGCLPMFHSQQRQQEQTISTYAVTPC